MKKFFSPLALVLLITVSFSCSTSRLGNYLLTQGDAASAIRQMLEIGSNQNLTNAFSKDQVLNTVFPGEVSKILNTLNMLGLTSEIDRFTTTLSSAAEKTATASVPIFVNSISHLSFVDAIRIVKNGGICNRLSAHKCRGYLTP